MEEADGANLLGAYGATVAGWRPQPAPLSYRSEQFDAGLPGAVAWRTKAKAEILSGLCMPPDLAEMRSAATSTVRGGRVCVVDGVRIEEISWQLPAGPETRALLLKPAAHREADPPLPALLVLHCHGGNKVLGFEKVVATDAPQRAGRAAHQATFYGGRAWANEVASRGFAVLVQSRSEFT